MSPLPRAARVVVIGAGIVGNSLACHLARLGWTGIVQLDKGPLPNPGGSTGHASNFIFPVDHSREMTALTADSVRQYRELGVLTECGGIEVARTEERMEELRRRVASAKAWGIEPVELLTPEEIKALVPYIDESVILGGFYSPGVGVVDSLRAGTLMREEAQSAGALEVVANVEVTGIDVEHGRVRRVRTTAGDVEAGRRRDRVRRLEPAARGDGGRLDPAHPRRAPDDRHRAGAALRRRQVRDRVPDRARHGREHVRAPGRERARDRLLCPPPDPARPRGHPLGRGGGALADGVPVHRGRLRPADGARARAHARDRGRRVGRREVRDQRPALADRGRAAGARRDARGQGPVVGAPRCGSRRARASGAGSPSG